MDENLRSIGKKIFPTWLFYSLVWVYGFYIVNSTARTFFGFSLTGMISGIGEYGQMLNWIIYMLRTGLTLWLFYCLYRRLNRLSGLETEH